MDTVRYELGAPFPFEEGCRESSAVVHAPTTTIHPHHHRFGGSIIRIPSRMGKLCPPNYCCPPPLQIFGPSAASGEALGQKEKRQLAAYLAKNIQITIIRTHWKVRVCAKLQK